MPATILLPVPTVWGGSYSAVPDNAVCKPPTEGFKSIPMPINWDTDGGNNNCIAWNAAYQGVAPVSQLGGLFVDNTQCGSALQFYFPDTQFELVVPANTAGYFPVITNVLAFQVYAPTAGTTDKTFVQVLNWQPMPSTISDVVYNDLAAAVTIGLSPVTPAPQVTPIIASGNWILTGFEVNGAGLYIFPPLGPGVTSGLPYFQGTMLMYPPPSTGDIVGAFLVSLFPLTSSPNLSNFIPFKTFTRKSGLLIPFNYLDFQFQGYWRFFTGTISITATYRPAPGVVT